MPFCADSPCPNHPRLAESRLQDALIIVAMIAMVGGAFCLLLLSRLIYLKIDKEKGEIRALEDYTSQIDRAPILDLIYAEEHDGLR